MRKFTHCSNCVISRNEPHRQKDHIKIGNFTKFGYVSLRSKYRLCRPFNLILTHFTSALPSEKLLNAKDPPFLRRCHNRGQTHSTKTETRQRNKMAPFWAVVSKFRQATENRRFIQTRFFPGAINFK